MTPAASMETWLKVREGHSGGCAIRSQSLAEEAFTNSILILF